MNTNQLDLIERDWIENALAVFEDWLSDKLTPFSSDDLHPLLGDPPQPNWLGVLLSKAKKTGLIEQDGWKTSARKEANGRVVRTWRRKF